MPQDPDVDADHREHRHNKHGDGLADRSHHAARSEQRIVRTTVQFPARPMETKTGLARALALSP
jgi:hypothetical protein